MQLNERVLTGAHRDKLKALVAAYRDGSRADKISSTQQAAVYANANYLLFDTVCATCEKADALMRYLLTYFAETPKEDETPKPAKAKANKQKLEPKPNDEDENINQ